MILCIQTGAVFLTVKDAAEACVVLPKIMRKHLDEDPAWPHANYAKLIEVDGPIEGPRPSPYDHMVHCQLRGLTPYVQPSDEDIQSYAKGVTASRCIRCLNTRGVFQLQVRAAEGTGMSQQTLSAHLRGVKGYEAPYGIRFEYVENYRGPITDPEDNLLLLAADQTFTDGDCGPLNEATREVLRSAAKRPVHREKVEPKVRLKRGKVKPTQPADPSKDMRDREGWEN